jgi:hypothetical protein
VLAMSCISKLDVALPDTLQVHGPDLNNMSCFFALENAISAASGHASNIKQFRAVDHVII